MNKSVEHNDEFSADREDGHKSSLRRCIVTKQVLEKDKMIRFVASPQGEIFPDLGNILPGRGIWIRVGKKYVVEAVSKRMFSKAAKKGVKVSQNLPDELEALIKHNSLQLLGLSKKAGLATVGYEKVRIALQNKKSGLLFAANDGSEDGRGKIKAIAGEIPIIDIFTSNEISEVLGRVNSVHVYVKKGKMAKNLFKSIKTLKEYMAN